MPKRFPKSMQSSTRIHPFTQEVIKNPDSRIIIMPFRGQSAPRVEKKKEEMKFIFLSRKEDEQ